jgi:uncharacterized membrane protein YheB (UPF0754 family)
MIPQTATLVAIPLLSSLVGYLSARGALRFLFWPRTPIRIAGFTLWGVIPSRKQELGAGLVRTAGPGLFSREEVRQTVMGMSFHREIAGAVSRKVDVFIDEQFGGNPLVGVLLPLKARGRMKAKLVEELEGGMPAFMESLLASVEQQVDFDHMLHQKIDALDLRALESVLRVTTAKELRRIALLGAALGLVVGLAQAALVAGAFTRSH